MNPNRSQIRDQIKTRIYHAWGALSQSLHKPYKFILILASARSGSTLLAHLLTSHPDIFGIGESKIALVEPDDYQTIVGKNLFFHWRRQLPRSGGERYILDKMVHNHLLDPRDIDLLNHPDVHKIFLLREPGAALASYMRVMEVDETVALERFVARLQSLCAYAQGLAEEKESVLLTYHDILEYTQPAFNLLQDYLDLQQPLSENYQVTNTTGLFGLGDNSENIKSGRILTARISAGPQLSSETLAVARGVYRQCMATLKQYCLYLTAEMREDCLAAPVILLE